MLRTGVNVGPVLCCCLVHWEALLVLGEGGIIYQQQRNQNKEINNSIHITFSSHPTMNIHLSSYHCILRIIWFRSC